MNIPRPNRGSCTEPLAVRRKLAEALRKRSKSKRYTATERTEFSRMADAWTKTLPKK